MCSSEIACYHSVQNLLSSSLLAKKYIKIKTYRNIILPVFLYGCETWSLTMRESRLRLFENWVLRRIFGLKRDEVTGEWRKLHNEELNDVFCSLKIIRVIKSREMRWADHVELYTGFWWGTPAPEGKRTLGRPSHRWDDNIKIDLQEVGCEGMDWFDLAQDRDR